MVSVPYSALIASAEQIVLATLVDVVVVEPDVIPERPEPLTREEMLDLVKQDQVSHTYRFAVREVIAGGKKKELSIETVGVSHHASDSDFDRHTDYRFWLDNGGRLGIESDCSLKPTFELGRDYLLVLGGERHRKGFELVVSRMTAWLSEVRRVVAIQGLHGRSRPARAE